MVVVVVVVVVFIDLNIVILLVIIVVVYIVVTAYFCCYFCKCRADNCCFSGFFCGHSSLVVVLLIVFIDPVGADYVVIVTMRVFVVIIEYIKSS